MLPDQSDRKAWLNWRRKGIGSSDVPAILGLSPYKDAFEVFQDKTGRTALDESTNPAIERGNELEPVARKMFAAWYNLTFEKDETFGPRLFTMSELPYMRTSLDGITDDGSFTIEIKYQGKEAFKEAKRGIIPSHHYIQMQHQLLVSGAKAGWHVSINNDHQMAYTPVERDERTMVQIVDGCKEFWGYVESNRWPGESMDDAILAIFEQWDRVTAEIKELEQKRKDIQTWIYAAEIDVCGPYRVQTITRKGNVQYAEVPELKGVDLEAYRAPTKSHKQITKV